MRTSNRTPRFLLIPLAKVIASFLFVFLPTAAQQVPGPATHLGDKYTAENHLDSSRVELLPQSLISNDRLFYALPNFLTVESSANLQPLTTRQKFNVVARSSFYYFEVPWYATTLRMIAPFGTWPPDGEHRLPSTRSPLS